MLLLGGTTSLSAQKDIFDKATGAYKKVFVETDQFDASYLKTLQQYYPEAQPDSIKFSMLNDLAYYWHTRNLTTAMSYTREGLVLTQKKNDALWYGRFQITQAAILLRQEKLDSAFTILKEAAHKVNSKDLANLNTQLGYVFERKGQLDKAADYAIKSLELGRRLDDKKAQVMAYSDLSNLFWKQSKFAKGVEFGLKSLKLFEEWGLKDLDYDFTLYVVANNYLELKNFKKALNYFKQAEKIGKHYGFYNNLSDIYISQTDLFAYLGKYEKAQIAGENALKYAELLDNNFMMMRSWLSLGKLQNLRADYNAAVISLNNSIEVATKDFGDEYYLNQTYGELALAYENLGDFKNALAALKKHERLKDIIFTKQADQRISLLQTEFDVALKEETINLQQEKISQQQTRQTLILILTGLLLLFLGVLYTSFSSNKKKNKLLYKQNQEKVFLLKEIHHRVKNNLEIISSLLALHSSRLQDPLAIEAMQESQNRVHSMGMIHQRLYKEENLGTIEMRAYFINLGQYIINAFGMEDRIEIFYTMKPLKLEVDIATPLGLIVNELLTNALKYAFPHYNKGRINIALKRISKNVLKLSVEDNGVGLERESEINKGFGTQLIGLLSKQLNGKISTYSRVKGTRITIEFTPYPAN
ncbi:Two-component sensor histidine kinase, contains HisKA and HATPase domains [Salegentibacter echinorum]|uniref:histidine kinase n=2 Tax=Salegentibacter echinorum TaxID=1073325 RepID=A0A1M5HWX5_SALEC|nr:Two-component sensor histidine kinase, contains HisKA and HATPase domains [Salegentibacter echinorum]